MNPKNGRKWRRMGKREDSTLKLTVETQREREREGVGVGEGVVELDAIAW